MAMDDQDKFREAWEQMHAQESGAQDPVSADEIIRKRSRRAVSKFRNGLLIELWAGVAVIAGLLAVYLLHPALQYGSYLLVTFGMMLVCVFYYYHQYKNLKRLEPPADADVKASLVRMLKWMNMFVLVYLRLNQVIIAFCVLILIITGMSSHKYLVHEISDKSHVVVFLLMILASVITTLVFYPIQKLYIRRMFGRYMQQLKDNLSELEGIDIL
jgi:hypothetical protein